MSECTGNAPVVSHFASTPASGLDSGTVFSRSGDAVLVSSGQGVVKATRAAGCLLEPELHDRVLLAVLGDGSAWVLSVLQRGAAQGEEGAGATVRLPDNSVLAATSLRVEAHEYQCTAESLTLKGNDLAIEGAQVRVDAPLLTLGGKLLLRTFETIHTVARRSSEHILHVNNWYAAVRERVHGLVDRKAGRARLETTAGLRVRAGEANIKAKTVLDLDAEHIRLG